jgi:GrpB-like predicted nucleotidyltransferase (UPF0157 family)
MSAIHEPIVLVPGDPRWPHLFAIERDRLMALYPAELRAVEHIGSTAVQGLPAKPIIDILAGVESMAVADALFEPLLQSGYTTSRAFNAMLPDRRWFMREADSRRTHHLHVVAHGGATWNKHVLFRDRLRADTALAQAYAALKSELALRHRHDRDAYTDAKTSFIESVVGL